MRKLIVANIVSLDGFYAGPGEDVMVLPMDHRFDAYNTTRIKTADTLLLGGTSYRMFSGFWPAMADDPKASPAHKEFARLENAIDKVVVSNSIEAKDTGPWKDTTRIVRRGDAHGAITKLKKGAGGDILMFGSHILWNDLLAAGLVDEVHFIVGSVVLGGGTPAFIQPPATPLKLLGTKTWDDSDNVLVRYGIEGGPR
jgi:dihydrofolate reductase